MLLSCTPEPMELTPTLPMEPMPTEPTLMLPTVPTPTPMEPITSASVRRRLRPSPRLMLLSSTLEPMELTPMLPMEPMPTEPTLMLPTAPTLTPMEPITSASVRLRLRPSLRLMLLSSTPEPMELTPMPIVLTPTEPTLTPPPPMEPTPMPMEPTLTWDKLFICKIILLRVSYLLPA